MGLVVNTFAAVQEYHVLNRENLTIPIQMQFSQKQRTFPQFLNAFLKSSLNCKYFETKNERHRFVFPNLRSPKTLLDKYLKSPISEDLSTSNMAHVHKHCWNLHRSIFFIFIGPCQVNWAGKGFPYWPAKSWDCFLTHWLPMKSILLLIETI